MYYKGAAAAIVVYDITKQSTFKTLQGWVEELRAQGPDNIAIAIAGNKCDLESAREVESSAAESYANAIGASFLETSAKTKTNVDEIFLQISKSLPAQDPETSYHNSLNLKAGKSSSTSCC